MGTDIHSEVEGLFADIRSYAESDDPESLAVAYSDLRVLQERIGGEIEDPDFELDKTIEILERYQKIRTELDIQSQVDFSSDFEEVVITTSKSIMDEFEEEINSIGLSQTDFPPEEADQSIDETARILLRAYADVKHILQYVEGSTDRQVGLERSERVLALYEAFKTELGLEQRLEFVNGFESQLKSHETKLESELSQYVCYSIEPEVRSLDGEELSTDELGTLYRSHRKAAEDLQDVTTRSEPVRDEVPQELQLFIEGWHESTIADEVRQDVRVYVVDELEQRLSRIRELLLEKYESEIEKQTSSMLSGATHSSQSISDMTIVYSAIENFSYLDSSGLQSLSHQCETPSCQRILDILIDAQNNPGTDEQIMLRLQDFVEASLADISTSILQEHGNRLFDRIDEFSDTDRDGPEYLIDGYQSILNVIAGRPIEANSRNSQIIQDFEKWWDIVDSPLFKSLSESDYDALRSSLRKEVQKRLSETRYELVSHYGWTLTELLDNFDREYADDLELQLEVYTLLDQMTHPHDTVPLDPDARPSVVRGIIECWEDIEEDLEKGRLDQEHMTKLVDIFSEGIKERRSAAQQELLENYRAEFRAILNNQSTDDPDDPDLLAEDYREFRDYITDSDPESPDSLFLLSDRFDEFAMVWDDFINQDHLEESEKDRLQEQLEDIFTERLEEIKDT